MVLLVASGFLVLAFQNCENLGSSQSHQLSSCSEPDCINEDFEYNESFGMPCTAPDGTIYQSGERALNKWTAHEFQVSCSGQSATCENGSWKHNVIRPTGEEPFEVYLARDECTPVGYCAKNSDTYVVQAGISQQLCEQTYYTGGYHQSIRGEWRINQGPGNVCGITPVGQGYCYWDD